MTPDRKDKPMKEISLHGGFGDVVQLIPYLKIYKDNHPEDKLKVYYREDNKPSNPKKYSIDTTRCMSDNDGKRINARREILECLPFIEEIQGHDFRKSKPGHYWHPTKIATTHGWQANPTWFTENIVPHLYDKTKKSNADKFWKENNLNDKFVICMHFRRSLKELVELYKTIVESEEMGDDVRVIMMGSTEHEIIPTKLQKSLSVVDSYKKGLGLMDVLSIGIKSSLFLGGRGGFEIFFWLAKVPSLNIFDGPGWRDLHRGLWWPESYWEENTFKDGPILWKNVNPKQELEEKILPLYRKWKKDRKVDE